MADFAQFNQRLIVELALNSFYLHQSRKNRIVDKEMKKDIPFEPVTGVMVAIVPQDMERLDDLWDVMIINKNLIELENVMVVSRGYGTIEAKEKKTSTLRHYIQKLEAQSIAKIEPIQAQVFPLTNEYWVSYFILDQVFDKKYIFVPDSIQKQHLVYIKELDRYGVLHT